MQSLHCYSSFKAVVMVGSAVGRRYCSWLWNNGFGLGREL